MMKFKKRKLEELMIQKKKSNGNKDLKILITIKIQKFSLNHPVDEATSTPVPMQSLSPNVVP